LASNAFQLIAGVFSCLNTQAEWAVDHTFTVTICTVIARQHMHGMQSAILFLPIPSVCPFVQLSWPTRCGIVSKQMHIIVKLFPPSGRVIALVFFSPIAATILQLNGALNTLGPKMGKFCDIFPISPFSRNRYAEGPWLLQITNRNLSNR